MKDGIDHSALRCIKGSSMQSFHMMDALEYVRSDSNLFMLAQLFKKL
jgi:hypothetical protein